MICKKIDIWEGRDYAGENSGNPRPYMDTYILKGDKKRPTVLVLPGGGYEFCSPREAEPIAMQFAKQGYNAFVLYYSVAPNKHPQPILDVSLAMATIRRNADEWNVEKDKIFVCGFSAGGHLTASIGVHWNKSYIKEALDIKQGENKPNGLILCYPVIHYGGKMHKGSFLNLLGEDASPHMLAEMSLEKQVSSDTPPAFIWHTFNDGAVPVENSLMFAQAMREHDIPFELHIFPDGVHGLSLATEETAEGPEHINAHAASWMDLCLKWIGTMV